MRRLQIFRSGTHVSAAGETLKFTDADLSASVSAYDPTLHEAPIVVGHPKTDSPAYGWVGKLAYREGVVEAEPVQVDTGFAELVTAGRFKKISASFYRPTAEANPKPGVYYLRHVGFLGGAPPSVKGLKPAEFTGSDKDIIEFGWSDTENASLWRSLRDWLIDKFSIEEADKVVPPWAVEMLTREAAVEEPSNYADPTETDVDDKELKRRKAELDERERKLKADEEARATRDAEFTERQKALDEKERKARQAEVTEYVDGLIKDGKLMPRFKPALTAVLVEQPATEIEFTDGEDKVKKPAAYLLREILDALPKQIDFGEIATDNGDRPKELTARQLAKKAETLVEDARTKGRALSYTEAMSEVIEAEGVST